MTNSTATRTRTNAASGSQIDLLRRLRHEYADMAIARARAEGNEEIAESLEGARPMIDNVEPLTKAEASRLIDQTIAMLRSARAVARAAAPAAPAPAAAAVEVTEGMYLRDGEIYKVQRAVHGSGNLYAKVLVSDEFGDAHFEMARGMIRKLRPEHRMTLEQAKEYGALYGVCVRCSKTLTKEESIERAMGDICAGKI